MNMPAPTAIPSFTPDLRAQPDRFGSRTARQPAIPASVVSVATLFGLFAVSAALAAEPLSVTLTADEFDGVCDQHCSLRDAIATANAASGPQLILLPAGDHVLSRKSLPDANGFTGDEDENLDGDLDVSGELVIQGRGERRSRIIGEADNRLIEVLGGAQLTLLRLGLAQGRTPATGGAIQNHGELFLRQVALSDNQAETPHSIASPPPVDQFQSWGQGGAIANYGSAQIHVSSFEHNKALALYWSRNLARGGAIFNLGNLVVRDSLFFNNNASDQGDNGYGGAIFNQGSADIARSLFRQNWRDEMGVGGGIANIAPGVLKLSNSTLSANSDGVYNGFEDMPGGPLASATLINVTIAQSHDGGLTNAGDMTVRNSLVVANYPAYDIDTPADCGTYGTGRFIAKGLLISSPDSNCPAQLLENHTRVMTELLYPLADNGGFTKTYALRAGSKALDAGSGSCSGHDQRRLPRPLDANGDGVAGCDLGAYELSGP